MTKEQKHGAMTDDDLARIYKCIATKLLFAPQEYTRAPGMSRQKLVELRGLIIAGENLGLELKACCNLRISNVDFQTNCVAITSRTGRICYYQMLPSFRKYAGEVLAKCGESVKDAPLFKIFFVGPDGDARVAKSALLSLFKSSGVRTPSRAVSYRFIRRRLVLAIAVQNPSLKHTRLPVSNSSKTDYPFTNIAAILAGTSIADRLGVLNEPFEPLMARQILSNAPIKFSYIYKVSAAKGNPASKSLPELPPADSKPRDPTPGS